MERVIKYIIYLCFLLIGGGQYIHANSRPDQFCDSTSWDFLKKQEVKLRQAEPYSVLIEEADTDVDEEFHNNEDYNKGYTNKNLSNKEGLLSRWYLPFSTDFVFKNQSQSVRFFIPYYGQSNPIYLKIGVLRI